MATIDELMENKAPGSIRIRLPEWSPERYFIPWFLSKEHRYYGTYWHGLLDELRASFTNVPNAADFSNSWELYDKPKKKKKLYKWAANFYRKNQNPNDYDIISRRWVELSGFYETEEEARKTIFHYAILIRVEGSMIEVDDED